NLSRSVRFKKENVILIELMPDPKEAKTSEINLYLRPLADKLEKLYKRVRVQTYQCPNDTTICAALFMVVCNISTARKVCGFMSHISTNTCHKCNCQFSQLAGTSSLIRTKNNNCKNVEVWGNTTTEAERHYLEVENDICWSKLHCFQYFDVVCYTIIDPMHNLFLG
ncbi:hypothetical protein PHYBLDRAFT_102215, partial [Phycomyces blakesleeanus NRRL 1555(-)]